jgi:hypothetical protein
MTNPFEEFREAAERTFEDGTSQLVLLVGSGLHHHLADHGVTLPADSDGVDFRDWNELLRAARKKRSTSEFSANHHEDPTATWESMLAKRAAAVKGFQSHEHERVLLKRVRDRITALTPERDGLEFFGTALSEKRFRDIVTVNFDCALEQALWQASGTKPRVVRGEPTGRPSGRAFLRAEIGSTRIWHPHGMANSGVSVHSLQLGHVAYARSVVVVQDQVRSFRAQQRTWRNKRHSGHELPEWTVREAQEWRGQVRGNAKCSSWVDQVLCSDLAFVGCGLDRAEADLWLALHERQRQLAQVQERNRPRAFFVHPAEHFPKHIATGPAGLIPVRTESYDEAWELVIGRWWVE